MSFRHIQKFTLGAALVIALLVFSGVAQAAQHNTLTLAPQQKELVNLPGSFTNVSIGDKAVLRVIKHSDMQVSLIGKSAGISSVAFSTPDGATVWSAVVTVSGDPVAAAPARVNRPRAPSSRHSMLQQFFPGEEIDARFVGGSLVLRGTVKDAETAHNVMRMARKLVANKEDVINLMKVEGGQQVMLRVQVSEVKRSGVGQLGIHQGGAVKSKSSNMTNKLNSLKSSGLLKVLAEPSLIAISGETAEFLAGGEFPVPVAQQNKVMSVLYKEFGVKVRFTPTVLSDSRIRLAVEPEVSELSDKGAVNVSGITIPALQSRKAKTTVELSPGESFMIAGLIKTDNFSRDDSELVIAITPYLVDPVVSKDIRLPTDSSYVPTILDRRFVGVLNEGTPAGTSAADNLEGPYGFMVE